jgi:hypothetical protein
VALAGITIGPYELTSALLCFDVSHDKDRILFSNQEIRVHCAAIASQLYERGII